MHIFMTVKSDSIFARRMRLRVFVWQRPAGSQLATREEGKKMWQRRSTKKIDARIDEGMSVSSISTIEARVVSDKAEIASIIHALAFG